MLCFSLPSPNVVLGRRDKRSASNQFFCAKNRTICCGEGVQRERYIEKQKLSLKISLEGSRSNSYAFTFLTTKCPGVPSARTCPPPGPPDPPD